VVGDDHRVAPRADTDLVHPPAQAGNRCIGHQQRLGCEAPHDDDDARLQQLDLALKKWRASGDFRGFRIAIARRTALEYVGDVDRLLARAFATQSGCGQHVVEQSSRLANKGLAACVFFRPGRFADEHPGGIATANAEDGLRAGAA